MTESDIDNKDDAVITVRCIDMAPYDGVEKRLCSRCGEMTWLSNHWEGKRIDNIICEKCFYNSEEYDKKDFSTKVTKECLESAISTIKRRCNLTDTDEEIKDKLMRIFEKKIGKKIEIIEN